MNNNVATVSIKELKNALISDLDKHLSILGFLRKGQSFHKKSELVTKIIHLNFIDQRDVAAFSVVVYLAVRHERVEDLVNSWRTDLSIKEKKATATLGGEIGQILGKGQVRYNICSEKDILVVVSNIVQMIQIEGERILNEYSDLMYVKNRLSSDDPQNWGGQMIWGRALRLPVIYESLGDKETASKEFERQYDYLKSTSDILAESYKNFTSVLCKQLQISNHLE